MKKTITQRPSVLGSSRVPGDSSNKIRPRAEGPKTHPERPRYNGHGILQIATYNIRTLSTEHKQIELEEELTFFKWAILGLGEIILQIAL